MLVFLKSSIEYLSGVQGIRTDSVPKKLIKMEAE